MGGWVARGPPRHRTHRWVPNWILDPRRIAPAVGAQAGTRRCAFALGTAASGPGDPGGRLRDSAQLRGSRPAKTHPASPHHLQRGAAASPGGALRAEPVPRRGHAGAPGRPHPSARGARGGRWVQERKVQRPGLKLDFLPSLWAKRTNCTTRIDFPESQRGPQEAKGSPHPGRWEGG